MQFPVAHGSPQGGLALVPSAPRFATRGKLIDGPTTRLTAGDLNGDGKIDLAVAVSPNRLLVGDGTGAFSTTSLPGGGERMGSVVLGDVNGDGVVCLAGERTQCPAASSLNDPYSMRAALTHSLAHSPT